MLVHKADDEVRFDITTDTWNPATNTFEINQLHCRIDDFHWIGLARRILRESGRVLEPSGNLYCEYGVARWGLYYDIEALPSVVVIKLVLYPA